MGEEGVVGSMPLAVATGVGGSWSHRIHWKLRDGRCYLLPGLLAPVLFHSEPQLSDSPLWRVPPYMPSGVSMMTSNKAAPRVLSGRLNYPLRCSRGGSRV